MSQTKKHRASPFLWTPDLDAKLRHLFTVELLTQREIAEKFDCSFDQIRIRLRTLDIRLKNLLSAEEAAALRLAKAQAVKAEKSATKRKQVIELAKHGLAGPEIRAATGLCRSTVEKFLMDARNDGSLPKKERKAKQVHRPVGVLRARLAVHGGEVFAFKHSRHTSPEEAAAREAVIAHARRTASLPPVQEDEAARLVAEFMARKGVTHCEPGFAAPINCGTGL